MLLVCYGSSGGGALPNFYLGNFKGFFAATSWVAAMASTAAGSPPAPVPGQRAYCPHHGRLRVCSVCDDSSGGGALPNFYQCHFKGFFGWLSSQQSTGFIGRKGNSSGVGKSEGKGSGEGSDVGCCGDVNCGGNRDSSSDS